MEGTIAPEQIIINGQSFSSEDATQLIELGNKYKKMESDLNTSLDKVYPEYTRLSQEKKTWDTERKELETLRTQQAEAAKKAETPNEIQNARKAAREIGLLDEDGLKEKGYMTRDETDKYLEAKMQSQRQADAVLKQCKDLETKIDGSDGRVPFDTEAVLFYANGKGIADVEEAYKQMNKRGNVKWEDAQIAKEERPGLTTLKGGGKKAPVTPKYTRDNLGDAIGEFLNGLPE
jgi:hypothetical protein